MLMILMVGLGGFVGAVCRYLLSLIPVGGTFPIITLITNAIGAFAIGCIVGIAEENNVSPYAMAFFKTGLCGGFTTFSTFSLEMLNLIEGDHVAMGIGYGFVSLGLCLIGVVLGKAAAKTGFSH